MSTFLVITSLSLAFYVGLLIFIYWEGRKRRSRGNAAYKVQAGSAVELGRLPRMISAGSSRHRQAAAALLVRSAANSGRGKLKSQIVQDAPAKVITLPALASDNDDVQCG